MKVLFKKVFQKKDIYFLILPGFILFYILFAYAPMYGIQIAFKDFKAMKGIWNSPWIGFVNFDNIFNDAGFWRAFKNTIIISFSKILFTFPIPIGLALLINDLSKNKFTKIIQTAFTLPHFLSWVVISGMVFNLFGSGGAANEAIMKLGGSKIDFLGNPYFFRPLLYITENWKEAGWSSIIYLAAMTGINPEIYEAADVDGANRFTKMFKITIPGIQPTIILLLILTIGNTLNNSFDQVYNLYNPVVYAVGDILDTYIFRITFGTDAAGDLGFSTAVGLFKSIINFILLITANKVAKKITGNGLF